MEHNWDLYFDTSLEYWKKLQEIYEKNDHYPKVVVKNRNLHHKFMRSFSKLEGTPIDNDKDNLVSLSEGDHFLVHWLLWKCTKTGYRTRTVNAVRLMYRKSLKYLSFETVVMIAKDWTEINHRPLSEEQKKKIGAKLKGRKFSKSHKEKIAKSLTGREISEEHRKHLQGENNGMYGKHHTEEAKQKMSEHCCMRNKVFTKEESEQRRQNAYNSGFNKVGIGRHWYNNEIKQVFVFECPEGFVPGRL